MPIFAKEGDLPCKLRLGGGVTHSLGCIIGFVEDSMMAVTRWFDGLRTGTSLSSISCITVGDSGLSSSIRVNQGVSINRFDLKLELFSLHV